MEYEFLKKMLIYPWKYAHLVQKKELIQPLHLRTFKEEKKSKKLQ